MDLCKEAKKLLPQKCPDILNMFTQHFPKLICLFYKTLINS